MSWNFKSTFLTYLSAIVARDLAEGFITVDDGEIDNLSIGQEEAAIRCNRNTELCTT
jgi:hypothetical protein